MTDEKKKDKKDKKDAKKIDDEQLKNVAGGTRGHEAAHVVQQKDGTETKKKDGGTWTSGSGTVTFDG
ncbi:MAG: hypothetical protein VX764_09020 [Planctomycetota bacterium]|nr:hypothetical protein [Planctomycetota bacterium]